MYVCEQARCCAVLACMVLLLRFAVAAVTSLRNCVSCLHVQDSTRHTPHLHVKVVGAQMQSALCFAFL